MSESSNPETIATAPIRVTGENYKPQLDGVRAICILFTITNHVPGGIPGVNGSVGVDIFFALSGWLITWLLVRERERTRSIDLLGFYIRRLFRIIPLYFLTVIAYCFLATRGLKATGSDELRSALPFMLTMNMEYRPPSAGNLFGHAWTLGIEEKFYLVWPLILAAGIRRPLVATLFAMLALAVLLGVGGITPLIARGYCGLTAGAAFAIIVSRHSTVSDHLRKLNVAWIVIATMTVPYTLSLVWPQPANWNLVISILAAVAIGSLWFNHRQSAAKILAVRPLAWLGRLTYAIYLVQTLAIRLVVIVLDKLHLPNRGFVVLALSYGLSVAIAWVLHIVIEKPLIAFGKQLASRPRTTSPRTARR